MVPSTSSRSWQRPCRVNATPPTSGGLTRRIRRCGISIDQRTTVSGMARGALARSCTSRGNGSGESSTLQQRRQTGNSFASSSRLRIATYFFAVPDLLQRLGGEISHFDADERAEIDFAAERHPRPVERIQAAAGKLRAGLVVVVHQLRQDLRAEVEADALRAAFLAERSDLLADPRRSHHRVGSDVHGDHTRVVAPDEGQRLFHLVGRAVHQVIEADSLDPELAGDLHHLIERLEALLRDGRVDADPKRRALAPGRLAQAPDARGGLVECALLAARDVVQVARSINRDGDCASGTRAAPARRAPRRAPR